MNVRFNQPLADYHSMDSYEFMHYINDGRTNGGQAPYFQMNSCKIRWITKMEK